MFVKIQVLLSLVAIFGHITNTVALKPTTCADHFGTEYCQYPLHWAALSGDVKGAMDAIQMGKNINEDIPGNGEDIPGYGTPLHQASFYGRASMVKLLLHYGADVDKIDLDGDTPLKATDIKWCFSKPSDRTCQMNPTDYRETIHLLTSGCKKVGCSKGLQCHNNKCVNLCDGISCGVNAECTINNVQAMCSCHEEYSGDPTMICLKLGDAIYVYKAFCFVKDIMTQISTAICNDVKSIVY